MANNKEKKVLNVPNSTDRRNVIRNVPHLRFPEFEGEWQKHKLCNIASIVGRIGFRGYTTNDIVAKGKGAIALSPTNIENNRLTYDKDNTYISFYKFEESPEIMIKQGDVVFVKTGSTVGKVAYVDKLMCKTTLNPQLVVLKNIQCDNYLLSVLMSTSRFQNAIRKITVGGAVPTLSQAAMGDIAVTMPQVAEQEKLSKFISLLDKRIATQNKIIEDLKKLKSAISLKMLHSDSWEQFKIKDIASIGRGRVISSIEISQQENPLYPVYSSQTSNEGIMGYLDNFMFEGEYISWTTDGANAGTVFYRNGKFNCTNVCGLLKLRNGFDTHFVSLVLSEATKKYVSINLANPKLMNNTMGNIQIRLPKFEEQKRISIIFKKLQELLDVQKHLLCKYSKQKQYLLHQMFI